MLSRLLCMSDGRDMMDGGHHRFDVAMTLWCLGGPKPELKFGPEMKSRLKPTGRERGAARNLFQQVWCISRRIHSAGIQRDTAGYHPNVHHDSQQTSQVSNSKIVQ